MTATHEVTVVYEGPLSQPGTLYHIRCEQCGPVGVPQEFEQDASDIAALHARRGFTDGKREATR